MQQQAVRNKDQTDEFDWVDYTVIAILCLFGVGFVWIMFHTDQFKKDEE